MFQTDCYSSNSLCKKVPRFLNCLADFKLDIIRLIEHLKIPGAIVLIDSGAYEPLIINYGYADLEKCIKMNPRFQFRIGSITKTFTGIVFLQLCQEKKINLDDPVSKYLVGVPNGDNITIRQIGTMTSGIFNYTDNPEVENIILHQDPHRKWLPTELYTVGINGKPYFAPGQGFHYSNTNSIILALIIERITGNSIGHEIEKRILEPLQLNSTYFATDRFAGKDFIQGYELGANHKPINVTDRYDPSGGWAASAIVSNVYDITKYCKYAIGKHVLLDNIMANQQRKFMSCTKNEFNLTTCYGFQLVKLGDFIGHYGSVPGYNCYALYNDKTDTNITIVVNTEDVLNNNAVYGMTRPANLIASFIVSSLQNQ